MKNILLAALVSLSIGPSFSHAAPVSKQSVAALVKRVKQSAARVKAKRLKAGAIVNYHVTPTNPQQGDRVFLFASANSGFEAQELILEGALNGAAVSLEHPASELWVHDMGVVHEIKEHSFSGTLYIQNREDAEALRNSISQLETEIQSLNQQIADAVDPEIIAELTALRDEKVSLKNQLVQALASLKAPVGVETFEFRVRAKSSGTEYPRITAITPNVVSVNQAKTVTISGVNFGISPTVLIGGLEAEVTSSFPGEIIAAYPGSGLIGAKHVEVRLTNGTQVKNAFLNNGLFVTADSVGGPGTDYAPVAVASAVNGVIEVGSPAMFGSANSYDPEGSPLRREWRLISKPTDSALEIPTDPPETAPDFAVTPDVPGHYVAELRIYELEGLQQASFPSLAVVQVNAPENHAPTASAPPIATHSGATGTSQIVAADEDAGQALSYAISTPPSSGSASVSPAGLASYTADATFSGDDSFSVTISDNGVPQRSVTISIPVSVAANQVPVIGSNLFYTLRSQGVPYMVALTTQTSGTISDPDGTIASLRWDFGDGTQERTFDAVSGTIFHNYVSTGSFTAKLTVVDNVGASASKQIIVNVIDTDIPTAKFKVSPSNGGGGAVPLTITFDASISSDADGIASYRWRWGNVGSDEVTTNPIITHTFTEAGTYPVRLRTRDSNQAQGEAVVNVVVGEIVTGAPSQAQFTIGPPREIVLGSSISFDGSRSFNPNVGGGLAAYNWNFGDFATCPGTNGGCTGTGISTSYIYPNPTNFFPSLQVQTGGGGLSQRVNQELMVVNSGHAPRAILRASAVSGVGPLTVNFDASESYDYDGSISGFGWSFGDGSPFENGEAPSHVFSAPGVYLVRLLANDDDFNVHSVTQTITVTASRAQLPGRSIPYDPEREYQRQILAGACGAGDGEACSNLAKMYAEDGDEFTSAKLLERACALGFLPACGE